MFLDIYDPKAPPQAIGIDLGTTHSIVAVHNDSGTRALNNCDGTALLASVVYFGEGGQILTGQAAVAKRISEPLKTIASAKRYLGRSREDVASKLDHHRILETDSDGEKIIRFDTGGRNPSPIEVSAEILKSLKNSATEQLQSIGGAVITVPAYFDDAQRQATKDAAKLAGLQVLRLLNEPTAAALAYGLDQEKQGVFAVYDLGGGTFDVTILNLDDGVFHVRSTGGDSSLGGDDMDAALAHVYLKAMGVDAEQASPEVMGLVLTESRRAKHALSEHPEVSILLPAQGGGEVDVKISREEFDTLIDPILARTGRACKRAVRDAELAFSDIQGVILVGGSTRVPAVRRYVKELFGREPLCEFDPDLVVAYGAAISAQHLSEGNDEVLLLDVLPLSLGVETMGGGVDKILPRNSTIPCAARASFTTYADNQTGFDLHVVQGERELAQDCRSLARFTLKGIPPLPAGQARLELSFTVDENSLLTVSAVETTTGIEQQVEVTPSYGLTDDEVEKMLIDALDFGEEDFERRRLEDAKVEAGRIILATEKGLNSDGHLLSAEEAVSVPAALEALRLSVAKAQAPARIQMAIDTLDRVTHDWAGRRMDSAVQKAIAGKSLEAVESDVAQALGVDAHVSEHEKNRRSWN